MRKYNCKTCGAELSWNPETESLKCQYCDSEFKVEDFDSLSSEEELANKDAEIKREVNETDVVTDDSEGGDYVVYKCSHCNAEVITSKSTIATTCAYCGRNLTIFNDDTNEIKKKFSPKKIIPFLIKKDDVKDKYSKHIKKSPLVPKDFEAKNIIEKIKGIYVPFWLFDLEMEAKAEIEAQKTTSISSRNHITYTTEIFRVDEEGTAVFEKIPADGLKTLDNELVKNIEPYDYNKITDYNPTYMAGYYAECYNEDQNDVLPVVVKKAEEGICECFLNNVKVRHDTKCVKNIQSAHKITNIDYAMLPLWLMYTNYKGKDYLFGMNGETGKFYGKIPMNKKKLFLIVGAVFLGGLVLGAIFNAISFFYGI